MKKIISLALVCLMLTCTMLTLASCGLSGTYKSGNTSITFSGKKVTIVDEGTVGGVTISKTYEAEYSITDNDDGSKTITFIYADDADKHLILNGEKSFATGEENGKKYVKIGILTYYKAK